MNQINQSGWKPGTPIAADHGGDYPTVTGNKALMLEEPLLFELGTAETCGVDLPAPDPKASNRLGPMALSLRTVGLAYCRAICTGLRPSETRKTSWRRMRSMLWITSKSSVISRCVAPQAKEKFFRGDDRRIMDTR